MCTIRWHWSDEDEVTKDHDVGASRKRDREWWVGGAVKCVLSLIVHVCKGFYVDV